MLRLSASERVVPSKVWESAEVGVGGHKCAAVLHRYSGMLGIGDQLPCSAGLATYSVEDLQVVGSGTHDARGRALHLAHIDIGQQHRTIVSCA